MLVSKSRKGTGMVKILDTLANAAVAYSRHPGRNSLNVYRAMRDFRALQEMSDRQLRTMSRYVITKKYIVITKNASGARIEVTEKGKRYLEREALATLKPKRLSRWDRKWRIVMFDIPDAKKSARDAFAGTLKRFEFERLQKSVFISPYPCEEELQAVADYYGISEDIDIIIAESFGKEAQYKKLFKI